MISTVRHNLMLGMAAMGAAASALVPAAVRAQTSTAESKQAPAEDNGTKLEEIVVTGTLFRGNQAPVGSDLISVGRDNLETAGAGRLKNLNFTLNVNNVLDRDPPVYKLANGGGYDSSAGTFTLGREFILGAQVKF
jgi:hypothetical protein